MHRQPRPRRLLHPARSQRPCRPARRPRALRLARHPRAPLSRAVGTHRARRHRPRPTGRWPDRAPAGVARSSASTPIVGLVHHGSGPRHTSLLDPRFAEELAEYAGAVAERYPWVEHWTPVNEPLTTARFSGLYGLWYPHARDDRTFVRALLNQCRAIVLSMRAIRARQPGRADWSRPTTSAAPTAPRRWRSSRRLLQRAALARLGPAVRAGRPRPSAVGLPARTRRADADELLWFARPPLPARRHRRRTTTSPASAGSTTASSATRAPRAAARRASRSPTSNPCACWPRRRRASAPLLQETWQRYGMPIAVTEAHIDANREDQLRWLLEIWSAAQKRARGRRRHPRRHALGAARLVRLELPAQRMPRLLRARAVRRARARAAADRAGGADRASWPPAGRRAIRCCTARAGGAAPTASSASRSCRARRSPTSPAFAHAPASDAPQPILITGASGTLGQAFARSAQRRNLAYRLLDRARHGHRRPGLGRRARSRAASRGRSSTRAATCASTRPKRDVERCMRENALGPASCAAPAPAHGIRLRHVLERPGVRRRAATGRTSRATRRRR